MAHAKQSNESGNVAPAVEGTSPMSDDERRELLASLKHARADIAAGNYDVVTSETLRAEFDGILNDDKSDDELDMQLAEDFNCRR